MKKALLVDASSLYWTHWHSTKDEPIGSAFERTVQRITQEASYYDYVAVCEDRPPYKRKELSAEYKAQRDAPEPAAIEQFKRVKERLRADGYCIWGADGYEADDVIATAVHQWETKEADDPVERIHVLSSDKDLLQLVAANVFTVSVRDGKTYGKEEVLQKFGVEPDLMRDLLALMGDKSDNIPGVPGVGPKHAGRLLLEFGSIDGILQSADKIAPPSIAAKIVEHGDSIRLSRQLVTLMRDAPIRWDDIFQERRPEKLTQPEPEDAEFEDMPTDEGFDPISPPPKVAAAQDAREDPALPSNGHAQAQTVAVPQSTAIVPANTEWSMQLEPQNAAHAFALANKLYNSRLYTKFPTPEAIGAVIIRGRELGLGALTALDMFHVVEGRPTMSAHLIVGLVKNHPACEYFMCVEHDDQKATWEGKRKGEPRPTRLTFSMEDAKRADLLRPSKSGKPSQWDRRPKTMLRWSAGRELARLMFPDIVGGLYSDDEIEERAA